MLLSSCTACAIRIIPVQIVLGIAVKKITRGRSPTTNVVKVPYIGCRADLSDFSVITLVINVRGWARFANARAPETRAGSAKVDIFH